MLSTRLAVLEFYDGFRVKRMAELAPGIVAVEDESGECDAIFETKVWAFKSPGAFDSENLWLEEHGLAMLQGTSGSIPGDDPLVNTIEKMLVFAREWLVPKDGKSWHDAPKFFKEAGDISD